MAEMGEDVTKVQVQLESELVNVKEKLYHQLYFKF